MSDMISVSLNDSDCLIQEINISCVTLDDTYVEQSNENAIERSGVNGPVAVMPKLAVVGQDEVGEPLRVAELVPEAWFLAEDGDLEPEQSCSAKPATQNVSNVGKRTHDADAAMLALEREFLREKRRKNDIAEAHLNALNKLNEILLKVLERLPPP